MNTAPILLPATCWCGKVAIFGKWQQRKRKLRYIVTCESHALVLGEYPDTLPHHSPKPEPTA